MYQCRSIVTGTERFDSFAIAFYLPGKTFDYVLGLSFTHGIFQINEFLCFSQSFLLVHGDAELFPERPPIQYVPTNLGTYSLGSFKLLVVALSDD